MGAVVTEKTWVQLAKVLGGWAGEDGEHRKGRTSCGQWPVGAELQGWLGVQG